MLPARTPRSVALLPPVPTSTPTPAGQDTSLVNQDALPLNTHQYTPSPATHQYAPPPGAPRLRSLTPSSRIGSDSMPPPSGVFSAASGGSDFTSVSRTSSKRKGGADDEAYGTALFDYAGLAGDERQIVDRALRLSVSDFFFLFI